MTEPFQGSQPVTIHQFHAEVADRRVVDQMRFIRASLDAVGIAGRLLTFAKSSAASDFDAFRPQLAWNADLMLVHHSTPSLRLREVMRLEIPKAILRHPPVPSLHAPEAAWAEEQVRGEEKDCLKVFGPLAFPVADLSELPSTSKRRKAQRDSQRVLVCLGEAVPHHRQALWIQTLYYLNRENPGAYRLRCFTGSPQYQRYLHLLTHSLGIVDQVDFVPSASLPKCLSDADGVILDTDDTRFFWPLLQALEARLPVFYRSNAGSSRVMKNSGCRVTTRKPHRLAAIVSTILADKDIRHATVRSQLQRLRELETFHSPAGVVALCLDLIREVRYPFSSARAKSPAHENRI